MLRKEGKVYISFDAWMYFRNGFYDSKEQLQGSRLTAKLAIVMISTLLGSSISVRRRERERKQDRRVVAS